MSETTAPESRESRQPTTPASAMAAQAQVASCDECLGSGGWFRYEPALEPSPGLLYLSCLQCRGSGRTALPRA
jgi:hypothetical protein